MSSLIRAALLPKLACYLKFASPVCIGNNVLRTFTHQASSCQNSIRGMPFSPSVTLTRHLTVVPFSKTKGYSESLSSYHAERQRIKTVSDILNIMDRQAAIYGRIDIDKFKEVLRLAERTGKLTEKESLQLLRSTGSLMIKQKPETRHELFLQVWNKLPQLGVELKTVHYNAALRVQIENRHPFSVTEVLNEMGTSETTVPSRVTYQMLIVQFCEEGDVEGARKILEYMKSQDMPINYTVFNSLVKGYLKNHDVEGARDVLAAMRNQGLAPSPDTYKVMMCGLAEHGDMKEIEKVIEEAQEEAPLHARHYLETCARLVLHNHAEHFDKLLNMMPRTGKYNQDIYNVAYQLIAQGHEDYALKLLDVLEEESPYRSRRVIRCMIQSNRPENAIMNYYEKVAGLGGVDLSYLAYCAMYDGKYDLAESFLNKMKKNKDAITINEFKGVLNEMAYQSDVEAIINIAGLMKKFFSSGRQTITCLYYNALQYLISIGFDIKPILKELMAKHNFSQSDVNTLEFLSLIRYGRFEEAIKLLDDCGDVPVAPIRTEIIVGYDSSRDYKNLVKLLGVLSKKKGNFLQEVSGNTLSHLLNSKLSQSETEELAQLWTQQGLPITDGAKMYTEEILKHQGLNDKIIQKFINSKQKAQRGPQYGNIPLEELEKIYEQKKISDAADLATVERILHSRYCTSGRVDDANKLYKELCSRQQKPNALNIRQMAFLKCHYEKDLEEALKLKTQLEEEYPNFYAYDTLILEIAQLLISEGKIEDALSTISNFLSKTENEEKKQMTYLKQSEELLLNAVKSCEPSQCEALMRLLVSGKFTVEAPFNMFQILIKAYVDNGDLKGAINLLEENIKKYKRAPMFSYLLRHCIEKEETELLQRVVDLLQALYPRAVVLNHLLIELACVGNIKSARKVLTMDGMVAQNDILKNECSRLVNAKQFAELEKVFEVAIDLPEIDKEEMIFQLIRSYAAQHDWQKLSDAYIKFEEENITPRDRTLRYLSKVLEANGLPVPFELPKVTERKTVKKDKTTAKPGADTKNMTPKQKLDNAIQSKKVALMIDVINELTEKKQITPAELASSIHKLYVEKQYRFFFSLIRHLAWIGDIESLKEMTNLSYETFGHGRIVEGCLITARLTHGQAEEIMTELEKDPSLVDTIGSFTNTQMLAEKYPNLLPKYKEALEEYLSHEESNILAGKSWFNYLIQSQQYEEAKLFARKFPKCTFVLWDVFNTATEKKDENCLEQIKSIGLEHEAIEMLKIAFARLILLKVQESDWHAALRYCDEIRETGIDIGSMPSSAMRSLEKLLEANGQTPPWEAGLFQKQKVHTQARRADKAESSDSSDSSDSDNELSHNKGIKQ